MGIQVLEDYGELDFVNLLSIINVFHHSQLCTKKIFESKLNYVFKISQKENNSVIAGQLRSDVNK